MGKILNAPAASNPRSHVISLNDPNSHDHSRHFAAFVITVACLFYLLQQRIPSQNGTEAGTDVASLKASIGEDILGDLRYFAELWVLAIIEGSMPKKLSYTCIVFRVVRVCGSRQPYRMVVVLKLPESLK